MTDTSPELQAALDRLADVGATFKQLRDKLADATTDVRTVAVDALRAGAAQKTVIDLTGYTRESIRSLAREHGIERRR